MSPPISSPSLCNLIPTRLGLFSLNLCHYISAHLHAFASQPGRTRRRANEGWESLRVGTWSLVLLRGDVVHARRPSCCNPVSSAKRSQRTTYIEGDRSVKIHLTVFQTRAPLIRSHQRLRGSTRSICAVPTPGHQTEPSVQADRPSDVSPRSPKPSRESIKAYRPRLMRPIASADDRHAVESICRPCTRTEVELLRRCT